MGGPLLFGWPAARMAGRSTLAKAGDRTAASASGLQQRTRAARSNPMSQSKQVRMAGTILGRYRHVCGFFHSKEEEYRVLLPFIQEGFDQGERAFHIVDGRRRADHVRRLG